MGTPFSYGITGGNWNMTPMAQQLLGLMAKKLDNQRAARESMNAMELQKARLGLEGTKDTNAATRYAADANGKFGLEGLKYKADSDAGVNRERVAADRDISAANIAGQKDIAKTNADIAAQAALTRDAQERKATLGAAGLAQFTKAQEDAEALGTRPSELLDWVPWKQSTTQWDEKRSGIDARRKYALGLMGVLRT